MHFLTWHLPIVKYSYLCGKSSWISCLLLIIIISKSNMEYKRISLTRMPNLASIALHLTTRENHSVLMNTLAGGFFCETKGLQNKFLDCLSNIYYDMSDCVR